MNRGLLGTAVGVIAAFLLLYSSYFVVHPSEWALVLQLGKPVRVIPGVAPPDALDPDVGPGLYFKIPMVQNVVYLDKRVLNFDAPSEEVPTVDQNQVIVSAYARFQIIDPLLFYQTVSNEDGVQARLKPIISSNLRRALGDVSMATILTSHRADLMHQITRQVNLEAQSFGIKVIDVRMKRVDLGEPGPRGASRSRHRSSGPQPTRAPRDAHHARDVRRGARGRSARGAGRGRVPSVRELRRQAVRLRPRARSPAQERAPTAE